MRFEAAGLKAGETVLLIGAGGGVGGAAAQIARRMGARVIGADQRTPRPDAPIHGLAERLIIGAEDLPAEVRAATGGKGADVVLIGAFASLAMPSNERKALNGYDLCPALFRRLKSPYIAGVCVNRMGVQ